MTIYNEAYEKNSYTANQANKIIRCFLQKYLGYNNRTLEAKLYREYFKNYFSKNRILSGELNSALEYIDNYFNEGIRYRVVTKNDVMDYRAIQLEEYQTKNSFDIMASLVVKGEKVYLVQDCDRN